VVSRCKPRGPLRGVGPALVAPLVALLGLIALLAPLPAGAETRVYEARHRPAEELLPLAETALGERGRAAADPSGSRVVMAGEAAALAEAVALLEEVDRPLRSVVLRYRSERTEELEARGVEVDWAADSGEMRVGRVRGPAPRHGESRGGRHGSEDDAELRVRAEAVRSREEGELRGTLRVAEGESARIATGTAVPVRLGTRGSPHDRRFPERHRHETTVLVSAESGFEATPRILGDGRVELALRPFEGRPGPRGSVRHAGAATTVVVEPGETVVVGSLARRTRASRRDLLSGAASAESRSERVLLISVGVE